VSLAWTSLEEDLQAICTHSPSLLHPPELRCYYKGQSSRGIGGVVRLRQAAAFTLTGKSVRMLPVTLSNVRKVASTKAQAVS